MTDPDTPYLRYPQVVERLERVAAAHDGAAFRFEGSIAVLRLTSAAASVDSQALPRVWLQGGLHGCEWIGPAVVLKLIDSVLARPEITRLAEWHFAPVVDAATYERTWTEDRYLKTSESGENLNLNFPFQWGVGPPTLERILGRRLRRWRGPRPASVGCVSDLINALRSVPSLRLFVDFHGFGRRWLHPWCHTRTRSESDELLREASSVAVEAANAVAPSPDYRAHSAAEMEVPMGGAVWTSYTANWTAHIATPSSCRPRFPGCRGRPSSARYAEIRGAGGSGA